MNNVTQKANEIYGSILKESDGVEKPNIFIKRCNIEYIIPIFIVSNENIISICETIWDDFEIFKNLNKKSITDFLSAMIVMYCGKYEQPFFDVMKINDKIRHQPYGETVQNTTEEINDISKHLSELSEIDKLVYTDTDLSAFFDLYERI